MDGRVSLFLGSLLLAGCSLTEVPVSEWADLQCEAGGDPVGGALPDGLGGWMALGAGVAEVGGLRQAWRFPGWRPMEEGDEAWWCAGGGSSWQARRGQDGSRAWSRGALDAEGLPHGDWRGGWDLAEPARVAFKGQYDHGQPSGGWSFVGPQGQAVGRGAFERGRPHGDWVVETDEHRVEARYVYGTLHGGWRETSAGGREVRGHYFNGTRNYEWDYLAPGADGRPEVVKRQAWKYDTFVVEWDPRVAPNPLPDQPLPDAHLGPDAEGMCRVHARCASNMYLTLLTTGHSLDPEAIFNVPFMVDLVEADAALPADEQVVLVNSFELDKVTLSGDEHYANVEATFQTLCATRGPGTPVVVLPASQGVTFDLRDEFGVWRLVRPLPHHYVRFDIYTDRIKPTHPAYARQLWDTCMVR